MGVIPADLKTLIERNYQVVEKEEDNMHPRDLHLQEEDIFDDDEDDTIMVSGQDCQNSMLRLLNTEKNNFRTVRNLYCKKFLMLSFRT